MSRNSLYNVISQEITPKTFRLDGVQTASLNRHQSGSPYFLFELAKEIQPFCIAPYSLESHHVSVYEQATSVLDLKSQYHYTAYFNDGNGSRFRLHVFYNQNDTLVTHPLLAKETADHEYEPISSHEYAEYDEVFSLFAAASTKKLVTHLRNTQNELLRKHDEQYQMMDDNASKLSKNLAENIEQYQTIITEMITKLEQAQNHANETKERGGKIALLKNIYKATKHYKPAPSKNEEVTETDRPKINKKTKTVGSNKPSQSRKSKAKHSKSKVNINQTQAEPVDLGLEALENRFSLWKESQVPEEINALHAALISIELMLSFKTDLVSVEDILRLERLKNEVEKAGERELKKCLYQSDLQKAEILSSFYPFVSPAIIHFALLKKNHQLLEFLFKKNLSGAEYKDFTINDTIYSSLIDFCFKDQRASVACLNVIINHGGSLLEMDRTTGLPYVTELFINPKHPMYAILQMQADKTINNLLFYKKLNKILHVLRAQLECTQEQTDQIERVIQSIKPKIEGLNLVNNVRGGQLLSKLSAKVEEQKMETLGSDLIRQIETDHQLQALLSDTNSQVTQFLKEVPPVEHSRIRKQLRTNYANIYHNLKTLKELNCLPSFEEIKANCIEQTNLVLQIVTLKRQVLSIAKNLTHENQLFNKGKLRRHNKKIVELNQLNEQIQKLVAELSEAYKPLDENKQVTHGELYQFMTTLIQNSTPHELQNELPNILNLLPNEEIQQFFKQEVSALLGTTDTVGTEDDDDDLDLSELGGIDLYEFAMRDGKEQRAAESKHRFFSSGVSSSSTASNSTNAELAKGSN